MSKFIFKVSRERDAYIEWSTVTDCPIAIGNRADFVEEFGEERLLRTDRNGTSANFPGWVRPRTWQPGGWEVEYITLHNNCPNTNGLLPRRYLPDVYDLLDADIDAKIPSEWVEPFDLDEE